MQYRSPFSNENKALLMQGNRIADLLKRGDAKVFHPALLGGRGMRKTIAAEQLLFYVGETQNVANSLFPHHPALLIAIGRHPAPTTEPDREERTSLLEVGFCFSFQQLWRPRQSLYARQRIVV